jgi:hypothetical protein
MHSRLAILGTFIMLLGCTGAPAPAATPTLTPSGTAAATTQAPSPPTPSPSLTPAPATATATATSTSTPAPTQTAVRPTASYVPTPTGSGQAPTPPPTADWATGWTGELVGMRQYLAPTLAIDGQGVVHAAGVFGMNIGYFNNSGGSWTDRIVTNGYLGPTKGSMYSTPDIVVDSDGSVWLGFRHLAGVVSEAEGVPVAAMQFITNRSGNWSKPISLATSIDFDWAVHEGVVHFVWQGPLTGDTVGCPMPDPPALTYQTNFGGTWQSVELARNGAAPRMALDGSGLPRIAFSGADYCAQGDSTQKPSLRYAVGVVDGTFAIEAIPDTQAIDETVGLVAGVADEADVLFYRYDGHSVLGDAWVAHRTQAGWQPPQLVMADAFPQAMAVDREGIVHIVLSKGGELWYAANATGTFEHSLIWSRTGAGDLLGKAALALGPDGRPRVLFTTEQDRSSEPANELWYGRPDLP